jgi:hypothetical protein
METRGIGPPRVGSLLELEPRFGGAFFVPGPASNRGMIANRFDTLPTLSGCPLRSNCYRIDGARELTRRAIT